MNVNGEITHISPLTNLLEISIIQLSQMKEMFQMRYFVDSNEQVHSYNFLVSKEIRKLVAQASKSMIMKVDEHDELSIEIYHRVMTRIVNKAISSVLNNSNFLEI